jgi:hypothetical protein
VSHLGYDGVEEVNCATAEFALVLEHLDSLSIEGLVVGDEILGTELESAIALLLVPIVDASHLDSCTTIGTLYLHPIVDASAVEHEEAASEYEVLLSGEANGVIGLIF